MHASQTVFNRNRTTFHISLAAFVVIVIIFLLCILVAFTTPTLLITLVRSKHRLRLQSLLILFDSHFLDGDSVHHLQFLDSVFEAFIKFVLIGLFLHFLNLLFDLLRIAQEVAHILHHFTILFSLLQLLLALFLAKGVGGIELLLSHCDCLL
jgi:hypothetical protein